MKLTPDIVNKAAADLYLFDEVVERPSDFKLVEFAQTFFDMGHWDGDIDRQLGTIAHPDHTVMAAAELRLQADEFQRRLDTQKTITEALQRQIEAEHRNVSKARMLLEAFVEFIPDHMLEPDNEDNNPDLIRAHHMATAFLKDTK